MNHFYLGFYRFGDRCFIDFLRPPAVGACGADLAEGHPRLAPTWPCSAKSYSRATAKNRAKAKHSPRRWGHPCFLRREQISRRLDIDVWSTHQLNLGRCFASFGSTKAMSKSVKSNPFGYPSAPQPTDSDRRTWIHGSSHETALSFRDCSTLVAGGCRHITKPKPVARLLAVRHISDSIWTYFSELLALV